MSKQQITTKKIRTFVIVNTTIKRNIASWVLLAVFVPMLLISSFHIHESSGGAYSCTECVHHVCHGHLAQQSVHLNDCVLCQFLTLTFVAALIQLFYYYQTRNPKIRIQRCPVTHVASCNIITPRAPPCV